MRLLLGLIFLFSSYQFNAQEWQTTDIKIYKTFEDLEPLLHIANDTTYVVNFWATWCGPCVKELPHFEALNDTYQDSKVKVILLSLDMERQIETKLIPFLNKNKIISEVVLLADGKAHRWIDKVDPKWSGAIPITLIFQGEKRSFFEQDFHSEQELVDIIEPFLNK